MKKIWVHKARSFKDAERFEQRYYQAMSAKERVETVDWLRQVGRKLRKVNGGKRLRRIVTIIQPEYAANGRIFLTRSTGARSGTSTSS